MKPRLYTTYHDIEAIRVKAPKGQTLRIRISFGFFRSLSIFATSFVILYYVIYRLV